MLFGTAVVALAASFQVTLAAPATEGSNIEAGLRLIKTSPEDAGRWVSEEEKLELSQQRIGFVDITDIKDESVLAKLSEPDSEDSVSIEARQAVQYPSSAEHVAEANTLISSASNTHPQSWLRTLSDYNNRHYRSTTGTEAGTWLFDTVTSVASANSAITVRRITHSFDQPSIIATLPGASSELVIIGAHYDSIADFSTTARSPGADDNASGTVVVLEALRVLASAGYRPQNTLEFHFYAGEEGGLLGSQAIFSQYRSENKTVLAMLNQDMTGYSPSGTVAVFTDYVDSALTAYVSVLATQYTGATPNSSQCGYGCSDHASARSNGFPAAFVMEDTFENISPYIHSSRDTYETIQWDAVLRHTKLSIGFLVEASYI